MFEKLIETISQLKNSPEIKKIIDELNITEEDVKDLESKFHEQIIQCKELLKDLSAKIREDLEPEQEVGPCINPCSEIKDCCVPLQAELPFYLRLYFLQAYYDLFEKCNNFCESNKNITNNCSSFDLSEKEIEAELIKSGWKQLWAKDVDLNCPNNPYNKKAILARDAKHAWEINDNYSWDVSKPGSCSK